MAQEEDLLDIHPQHHIHHPSYSHEHPSPQEQTLAGPSGQHRHALPLRDGQMPPKRRYKVRCKWPVQDRELLVQELVRQKDLGHQSGSGFLPHAWSAVADALVGSEERSGGDAKGAEECKSAYSRLKREYVKVKQLKRSFPIWNEEEQRPEADPAAKEAFLAEHSSYAPYFAGWPFFNAMERINDGVSTLDASIAKPLTTTTASYPGDGLIKREDSDHESDGSDISQSRSAEKRKRSSSNGGGDLASTTLTSAPTSSSFASQSAKRRHTMGGSGSDGLGAGLSAPVVPPAGEAGVFGQEVVGPGREDASLIRHRAREILWKDVKEEGWSLTEQDIINVLGRFDENATYAETYADIPYFTLRLLYLQSITYPRSI